MPAAARTVTAAYVQAPFRISFRQVELPPPGPGEILLEVTACGICGHDIEIAGELATAPRPFGHEIAGIVAEIGEGVTNVRVGDAVALESSSFCGVCDTCRNGRVDLCTHPVGFWGGVSQGFSEAMLSPAKSAVPAPGLDPTAAMMGEPAGVALDMIRLAEIGLTDRVLLVGAGAIGLMALPVVRRLTAGPVVAAGRAAGKLAVARRLGADAVVNTNETPLAECGQPYGGFNKVLVTAPPQTLPDCLEAAAYGGYVVFIGFDWGPGGVISLDTTKMHAGKKQLRSSMDSPALYVAEGLELMRRGVIPAEQIVSHRFPLSRLEEGLMTMRDDRENARKVAVIPDGRFSA
jgi:threonine dehydrogenase-like Zn-dependent dehydrogenase